jgi:dTDP-glucose pyrophosphorylase
MQSVHYKEIIINPDATLLYALKQMDTIRRKLLLVHDDFKYIGLLTIGDIQRAIINSTELNTSISKIIRNDNIIAHPETSIDAIKKLMLGIRAEFMPIVSADNKLLNVFFWEDLFGKNKIAPANQFNLPIVVMAGGVGSRLKPLTYVIPKPLIPIGEQTMIERIFEYFSTFGCNTFYISVNYKAELIEYYLLNQNLPYKLNFFKEEKPMGTAGSLSLLKGKIHETFFVSNCDILIDQDYSEILEYHKKNKNEITLVAALKHYPIPYGTVKSGKDGQLVELKEKPELTFKINSGMYILEPHLINEIPANQFFHITQLIEKVKSRKGKVGVFPVSEKSWKDVGNWEEYLKNKED